MLLLRILRRRRIVRRSRLHGVGVVDVVFEARWRSDGDYAGAELDADGDVVVGDEAAFAETDRQLGLGTHHQLWLRKEGEDGRYVFGGD